MDLAWTYRRSLALVFCVAYIELLLWINHATAP
jgi:hypothetical protein